MKNIFKVALTGGPCGGKTTSIERIKQEFTEKGFNVLVVPEAATLLINMSIRPFGNEALNPYDFQKLVFEVSEKLGSLLKAYICKIECKDGSHGTGFFCNIPYGWNTIKVLMTNNHVLKKVDILPNEIIKFSVNNDNKNYEIEIDESRKTYTNEEYDVTIIEIKEKDKLDKNSFFDIDNGIFNENVIETYRKKQIYLLHYPKGIKMEYSNGIIQRITEDNYNIHHLCDSSGGSSGGPIINSMNFQVIGIHKGGAEGAKNYNVGTLLKEPIEKFNEESNKKEKKENNKEEYIKKNEGNKIKEYNENNEEKEEKKVNNEKKMN